MDDRAERLAADLKVSTLSGMARALADEAVLITGRLENLDRTLRGDADAWIQIVERMPDHVAEVTVDKALSEVRQQGLALATVLKALAMVSGEVQDVSKADVADDLAKRRAGKRAAVQPAAEG